ncbi:MAG: ThiF family adenylyltransferase [Rhodocyclaceae bacterium]
MVEADVDLARRFGGVARLYGAGALTRLAAAHVCVVGIGGVGAWVAEALARSGVGGMTLIDLDHVAESNVNRQVHALESTLGQAKVLAMRARIAEINPLARVEVVEAFLTPDNADTLLQGFDLVVDAIDQLRAKVALVAACRARGIPVVVAGGAGGKTDPTAIRVADLARTEHDPLLAKLRRQLRAEHGFPRDPKRRFGVEAVFSVESMRRPVVCEAGDSPAPTGLSCAGYGSSVMVTASFGLVAAARALDHLLEIRREA